MFHVYVRGTYVKKHIHVSAIKFYQTLFLQMTDDHLNIRMYDKKVSRQCFIKYGILFALVFVLRNPYWTRFRSSAEFELINASCIF